MAKCAVSLYIFLLNFLVIYGAVSTFEDILDNPATCEEKCTNSFAPHTYPNGSENASCLRGCRLYTITKFVTADEPKHTNTIDDDGLSPAKLLCHHSCAEAYNETSTLNSACVIGCDTQELISEKNNKAVDDETGSSIHLLKPLMQIREVTSRVFGMLRIVQSSLTTYFMRDDNSLVAVEGPVEVMVQLNPENEDTGKDDLVVDAETKHESVLKEKINGAFLEGKSTFECFSKRLGVPPYLLLIFLVSFILFLTYVLFVVCTSNANKKKQKMQKSTPIPTHALPVKLVRPEDLTKLSLMDEEEMQAPELPTKVKLPNNTAI